MADPAPPRPRRARRVLLGAGALVAASLAYLLLWPVPIEPQAWTPPPAPAATPNTRLRGAEVLARGLVGPEDVSVDAEGRLYLGLRDGRVVRLKPGDAQPEVLATLSRPLGLDLAPDGTLWICDADQGLFALPPQGELRRVVSEAGGVPFAFTNDVDLAADGTVWFSDASSRFGVADYKLDLLEHRPSGRLLAYDPAQDATRVVLDGLYFANGVAVSADQTFVVVAETGAYRLDRVWIAGPRAGQHEVLVDDLPGFPDGVSTRAGGGFWVALASPRDPILDATLPHPFLRSVIARLPRALQPAPQQHGWMLGIDDRGQVTDDLQDTGPECFYPVTSVEQVGDQLYLGSLSYPGCARLPVPAR